MSQLGGLKNKDSEAYVNINKYIKLSLNTKNKSVENVIENNCVKIATKYKIVKNSCSQCVLDFYGKKKCKKYITEMLKSEGTIIF